MSVLSTMQFLPDPMAAAPKRQASDGESINVAAPKRQASDGESINVAAPSWAEAAAANWRLNEDDSPEFVFSRKITAYADLSDALVKRGRDASRYVQRQKPGAQIEAWGRVWADVEAERARDPQAFADIPATRDEFEVWAAARKGGRARDIATAGRGGLGTAILPGLGFGLLNGFQAENLPFLFMGGGARSASEFVVKQFVAGAQMTAVQAPQVARARAAMGEGYTPEQLGTDLVVGGALNAAVGAVATYGPPMLAKAFKRPAHERPPMVQAAMNVAQHAEDVDATNPFARTHAGVDAHIEKLTEALARIEAGAGVADDVPGLTVIARAPTAPGQRAGAVVSYMAAARRQESGGSDAARNPRSSATGRYQFIDGTWTAYYRKTFPQSGLTDAAILARRADGATQDRVMRKFTEDNAAFLEARGAEVSPGNLYVVHHLGQGGAKAVLDAAPGAPLTSVLPARVISANPHLANMTAGRFIAWADGRMGGDGVAAGGGVPDMAPVDMPAPPVVRPDALDAVRPQVTFEGREVALMQFRPDEIGVDAALMQFKSGGDQFGVIETLKGIQQWDPLAAGAVTVWEGNDGRRLIADGHQRLGLAKRIQAADPLQAITINAFVLREADGVSAIDARVATALKNVGQGSGTAMDAAKVLRDVGLDSDVLSRLPPKSALVRDGKALARLSPEAFGAAINDVIPESYAAAIGHLAEDPATHAGLVALLNKIDPPNRAQAESVIRQALDAGFYSEEQFDMFGGSTSVTALFAHKAKALDKALGELRKLKGAFSVAARNAEALDAAGNKIDVDASTAAAEGNARALDLVNRLALRKGNAVNAIFNDAAERLAKGEPITGVTRDVVRQLGELDLNAVIREAGSADGAGGAAGGSGRSSIADDALRAAPEPADLTPATRDELEAAGQGGFAMFDEEAGKAFDDPAGAGVRAVADSAWHDARSQMEASIDDSVGPFGPVFEDVDPRDWNSVVKKLAGAGTGEIRGALFHQSVGPIDVVWGTAGTGKSDGFGLSKLVTFHSEVLADLPRLIEAMVVTERTARRVQLESADHRAGIRLDYDGKEKTWLLTAFEKGEQTPPVANVSRAAGDAQDGHFPALGDAPDIGNLRAQSNAEPTFDLGDGKGARSLAAIEDELNAEDAAIAAIRDCQI